MIVSGNKRDLLKHLLIEYSKIDFTDYANMSHKLTDVAFIEISIEGAELYATVFIHKKFEFTAAVSNMTFGEQLSAEAHYSIKKVEVIESRVIINNDPIEISSHRLSAAHDEKLYKSTLDV